MAQRLTTLASQCDWTGLRMADLELAALLRGIAPGRPLSATQRAALLALGRVHAQAREQCEQASARLDEKMAQMRAHRAGWLAYAANDEGED